MILNRATIVFWFPRDQRQQKYSSVCQKNNYCFCSVWLGKQLFGNFTVYNVNSETLLFPRIILYSETENTTWHYEISQFILHLPILHKYTAWQSELSENVLQNQTVVNWTHSSASLAQFQQCICASAHEKLHWIVCMASFSISGMKTDLLCTSLYKMVLYTGLTFLN